MKRIGIILMALLLWTFPLYAQYITITDTSFLNALIEEGVDTNYDGLISSAEAEKITYLSIAGNWDEEQRGEITNLKGIEAFINLDTLRCSYNQLTSLDLSKNAYLTFLHCNDNQLSSLDISGCNALKRLDCARNQLTNLDLSNNTSLENLSCRINRLTSLDISGCNALEILDCDNNLLTSLDVSNNTSLVNLQCWENHLTSLEVSGCIALTRLDCDFNPLSGLDISQNTALMRIGLRYNPNLQEVCVWTMPFPSEGLIISTEGSPNVTFTSDCNIDR